MRKYFKILVLSVVALLASRVADAQWYVSGSVSSCHSNNIQRNDYLSNDTSFVRETRYKSNSFSFHPELGYYFKPNMAVGCGVGFAANRGKMVSTDTGDESMDRMIDLALSPFFRWDFVTTEHLSVGLRTMGSVLWRHPIYDDDYYKSNDLLMDLSLEPVLDYKFNDHWGASVYFGKLAISHSLYKRSTTRYDSATGVESFHENNRKINSLKADLSMEAWTFGLVYTF